MYIKINKNFLYNLAGTPTSINERFIIKRARKFFREVRVHDPNAARDKCMMWLVHEEFTRNTS
jgi:hypothetical protein